MSINVLQVSREGPFDPDRLSDLLLRDLPGEIASVQAEVMPDMVDGLRAIKRILSIVAESARVLPELDGALLEFREQGQAQTPSSLEGLITAMNANQDKYLKIQEVLQSASKHEGVLNRIRQLKDELDGLGSALGEVDALTSVIRRRVWRHRWVGKLAGIVTTGLTLGAAIASALYLEGRLEAWLEVLVPTWGRISTVIAGFVAGEILVEKPLESWERRRAWNHFERIRSDFQLMIDRVRSLAALTRASTSAINRSLDDFDKGGDFLTPSTV